MQECSVRLLLFFLSWLVMGTVSAQQSASPSASTDGSQSTASASSQKSPDDASSEKNAEGEAEGGKQKEKKKPKHVRRVCPTIKWHDGAYDYRRRDGNYEWRKADIYRNHVGPAMQQAKSISGKGRGGSAAGNLNYTLVRVPNHHQALSILVDYSFSIHRYPKHVPIYAPPECYLESAMRFAPDDPAPKILMGLLFYRRGNFEDAASWFEVVVKRIPNYAEGRYNYGLALLKQEKYEEAAVQAKQAYRLGYPLPALRRALKEKGIDLKDVK